MRFTPSGILDTSFGGGRVNIPNAASTGGVTVDMNTGNIIVLSLMTNNLLGLQRLNARGDVDPLFVRTFAFQNQAHQFPHGVRAPGNGKVLIAASTLDANDVPHVGVASVVLSSFAMDSSFGTSGRTVTTIANRSSFVQGFSVDRLGMPLVCGALE